MKVDFSMAWNTGVKILNGVIALLPNIVLGVAILILFLVLASLAKSLVRRIALRRLSHQGVALLMARLVHTRVTTRDAREVIIPNAVIFTSPVAVGRDTQKS